MSPNTRLHLILFSVIAVFGSGNVAAFTYNLWWPALTLAWNDYWNKEILKPAVKAGDRSAADCLGVSDFYSIHLTTYFQADTDDDAGGAVDDMRKYDEYCDRVPGTGRVIFSLTFMEKEVRNMPIGLSFFRTNPAGSLEEIKSLPPALYPSGMMSVDATVAHKGKYLLKVGFGEAKEKDDIIEMPIRVGQ
jgi:hypothetical protein